MGRFSLIAILHVTLLTTLSLTAFSQLQRFHFEEPKMGSPFRIILYSEDSTTATNIAKEAFLRVDSLNMIFSDYDKNSEVSRLSFCAGRDSFIRVSPVLYDVLQRSKEAWKISEGKFDITVGALSQLWRDVRRTGKFPNEAAVKTALSKTGMRFLTLDEKTRSVKISREGVILDLGGIAKGFVVQYILDYIRGCGISAALVDAGGDIACGDAPPGKNGWSVAISSPVKNRVLTRNLILKNQSIATSGNLYQYIEYNGKKFSHEIDPQSGYGTQNQKIVTVISADATLSDWLATACRLSSIKKSKRMAKQMQAEILVLGIKNGKVHRHGTRGIKFMWQKKHRNLYL